MAKKKKSNKKDKKTTPKPHGLQIIRDGAKFTFKWTRGAKYNNGQQLQYSVSWDGLGWSDWISISIGNGTTSKVCDYFTQYIDKDKTKRMINNYYPTGTHRANGIRFQVRGALKDTKNVNYSWSGWAKKSYDIKVPANVTTLTATRDSEVFNKTNFAWTHEHDDKTKLWFRDCLYESVLLVNSPVTNGEDVSWKSGAGKYYRSDDVTGTSGTIAIREESDALEADKSYTRWVRIQARGPQGNSKKYKYAYHRYAIPYQAVVDEEQTRIQETANGGTNCFVYWKTNTEGGLHPVDVTNIEYGISEPTTGMQPSEIQWKPGTSVNDVSGDASAPFSIDDQIGTDQCLFIRVNNEYDVLNEYGITRGIPVIPIGGVGDLSQPEFTDEIETDSAQHRATIRLQNNSNVPDSRVVVYYRTPSKPEEVIVGICETRTQTQIQVQCPNWGDEQPSFGLRAVCCKSVDDFDYVNKSFKNELMTSGITWQGGRVPMPPENVKCTGFMADGIGTIRVGWGWTWDEATGAILSWSDHEDAWMSTDEPDTYEVSSIHASQWNISGLETGKTYYVRVRLIKDIGEVRSYSPWSELTNESTVNLKSAPATPTIVLSKETMAIDETVDASWAYTNQDGTAQAQAQLCLVENTDSGYSPVLPPFKTVGSAQHVTLKASDFGGEIGNRYGIAVSVASVSGETSDRWSAPAFIQIAERPVPTIQAPFTEVTVVDDEEEQITSTDLSLTGMPFTVSMTGAGTSGKCIVSITRADSFDLDRPDESVFNGFNGEHIVTKPRNGDGDIEIGVGDLVGALDDGAPYNLVGTVVDSYGQRASTKPIRFVVHWELQAHAPSAEVEIVDGKAYIKAIAPENANEGDYAEIYRLSADRPELVVPRAVWYDSENPRETTYIDPYPAIGEHGGYRIVTKTANGDYTDGRDIAKIDFPDADSDDFLFDSDSALIDFGGRQIPIKNNLEVSNQWQKDFAETRYLGGSVQGDWNNAVGRTASVSTAILNMLDEDDVIAFKRLAEYTGVCHLRTLDGSSFDCDIQVSEERPAQKRNLVTSFSLAITRVDPETYAGMTVKDWED